jgi:hypothetical protein
MSTAWGERLEMLHEARRRLYSLPTDVYFELPGRPNVLYAIQDYRADKVAGAAACRSEMPFLFKAFETGQIGPRRLSRMVGENKPRNATIHEYLDWTVTGVEAKNEGEYVSLLASTPGAASGWRILVDGSSCGAWLTSAAAPQLGVWVGFRGWQMAPPV